VNVSVIHSFSFLLPNVLPLTCAAMFAAPESKGVLEHHFYRLLFEKWGGELTPTSLTQNRLGR
jgi:hypothetical protein